MPAGTTTALIDTAFQILHGLRPNAIIHNSILHNSTNKLCDLIAKEDWKSIEAQINHDPKSAKKTTIIYGYYDGQDDSRMHPLHFICSFNPPLSTLEAVIEAYPHGIHCKENVYQRLPLHIACMKHASPEAISMLLQYDGMNGLLSAAALDVDRRIPLHYVLSNGASLGMVKVLLAAYPEGVLRADFAGWLPIHVACFHGASYEVVKLLLKNYPSTIFCKTKRGSTPEGLAQKMYGGDDEIVKLLKLTGVALRNRKSTEKSKKLSNSNGAKKLVTARGA